MNIDKLCSVRIAIKEALVFLEDKSNPYTLEELVEELGLDFYDYDKRSFREQFPREQKHKLKRGRFYIYGTSDVITTVKELDESPRHRKIATPVL